MKCSSKPITRRAALAGGAAVLAAVACDPARAADAAARVLIVVGPSNHPPGTHEVAAGGRVLKHCLEAVERPALKADIVTEWPDDGEKAFADVASVVFIGDLFPPEVMPNRDTVMKHLAAMTKRGCGIVCLHYATGLEAKHVAED